MLEVFAYLLGLFIIVFAVGWLLAAAAKDIYSLCMQTFRKDDDEEEVQIILKEDEDE